jgi:hypothetical protein
MILLNHVDYLAIAIIASIISGIFFKILFITKSFTKTLIIFLYLPVFMLTYPMYHYSRIYKYRSDILRELKKTKLSDVKKQKIRKILTSKRKIFFLVVKSLIINFRMIIDSYIEVSADLFNPLLESFQELFDFGNEIKEEISNDTKSLTLKSA